MYLNMLRLVSGLGSPMSKSKIDKRLKRLTESGICSREATQEYAAELEELANKNVSIKSADRKSKIFKALADGTRLRILGLLAVREMCVCEVMVALHLTQPTASHHLRILENVGFVRDRKEGKWVFYSLSDPKLTKDLLQINV
jgi:DNA-binding transcriptional ArsR family regulator